MKVLYFDTETTGTDPKKHSIIQISGIIEVDGKIKEEFNFHCQPDDYDNIEPEALEVNGMTIEELKTFEDPQTTYKNLIAIFEKYVDKYDKADKFFPAGQNVVFDIEFLSEFFKRRGDEYFGSWQNWRCIDSRFIANFMIYSGILELESVSLSVLCDYFGVKIKAHDAMSDIKASREVIYKMQKLLK